MRYTYWINVLAILTALANPPPWLENDVPCDGCGIVVNGTSQTGLLDGFAIKGAAQPVEQSAP